jgi:hypothetical protein
MTAFQNWLEALEKRHLADLAFREVSRSVRALSADYVERRGRITQGGVLSGAGKRAAFALFYGPLHFLLVDRIAEQIAQWIARRPSVARGERRLLVDLGCGTGAAGAAWAGQVLAAGSAMPARRASPVQRVMGIDRNAWALEEAAHTYRQFGLPARTRRADVVAMPLPREPAAFLAAFTMNELPSAGRDALLTRLLDRGQRGDEVLIVEPLAGFVARWWDRWQRAFEAAGGRADEWRFRVELPPVIRRLDDAAGLTHDELTGRTLWLGR